jgi:hypothetical protein
LKSSSILFFVCVFLTSAAQTSSAQNVAVGNCRPHLVSYATISAAVAAATPNSTVVVCPGTYPEQVTITQPLTLRGLSLGAGSNPVITVPSGGLVGDPVQVSVQGDDSVPFGPVDISDLVVDGAGAVVDCSTATFTGIEYVDASGTLANLLVRNQKPGGCGVGISLQGSDFIVDTVKVRNSRVDNFDNTGILATSNGVTGFLVDLTANSVASTSTTVQSGIDYEFTDGTAAWNTILVSSGTGLDLDNFFAGMTARGNIIVGATIGISSGLSEGPTQTMISSNTLLHNGTGIRINGFGGSPVVTRNNIIQSSIAAIDFDCSAEATAEYNTIFDAPVGIANLTSGDTVTANTFYVVPSRTTSCP